MGNILKKIFSSFVALTTIAWSVGIGTIALPTAARAATAGDLIKASGPAVYYFAADGKRYVFPNEKTYFSWFVDFSGVRTISDTELASYLIGGNVTIRPGTRLVKIQTDPKVYAVTLGGVLHWVESEAIATTLYGSAWAQRVVDVPDSFFVNYTIGSSVSTPVHPDGTVVTYAGDTSRYVVAGGQKRMIASDAVYAANRFNPAFTITTTVSYPNHASNVVSRECELADVIAICGGVVPVGGNLQVSLASDTPPAQTVPKNAASVSMAKYNLTAGSGDVLVTGLRIRRIGVGATSDFSNVYLYDGNGNRLTTGRTINSSTNIVEFHGLNITIPAGQTKALVMVGDFSSPSTTGGQHSFEVSDAASVVISGTGTVSGSFPVRGNVFTVGTTSAGRLDVQKGTTPTNPNIGAQNAEISNFKLTANTNDIEVRRITLIQAGSVSNSDLTNLELWTGSTKVASAAALVGDKIVLNFEPPYVITNGTTRTFSLKAAIAGRASRTIKTYVEYTTDVYAIDRLYSSGAAVCIADTATGGCTTTGQGSFDGESDSANYIEVTTQGGQLTVSFNGPTAGNIAKGSQDVVLYKFSLASPDNTLEIRNVDLKIQGNTSSDKVIGSSGTEYFRDIKIINLDTGDIWMGPTTFPTGCADGAQGNADSCLITLSDSRNVSAGEILNLAVTADLHNGAEDATNEFYADGNNQYQVVLGDASDALFDSDDVRVVSTGEFLGTDKIVPNSAISGNLQTVKAASLTVSLAASPSAGTAVKKQQNIPVVGFVFTSGDQSDILVRTVKLTGQGSLNGVSYGATNTVNIITQCALFDGDTQVGLSQAPDTTAGTMNLTNVNVVVPAGSSKTLVAKCTADSTVDGTADYIAVGIDADADITAEDDEANSVTASRSTQVDSNAGTSPVLVQTIRSAGTLTVATDNLRQATILVGDNGAVWQNIAQFKATAQYEAVELSKLTVTSTGVAANFVSQGVAVAVDGAVKGTATLPSGAYKFTDVDMTSSPIIVPKDGSVTFQLWGKLAAPTASSTVSGSTNAARSGATTTLGIAGNIQTGDWDSNYVSKLNIRANGAASGDRLYATTTSGFNEGSTGNLFVLRKTKPVVTRQALSTTTLTSGLDMDLYKFQVSADSAGSVALKKIVFSWSKGDSNSSLNFQNLRLRKGTTDIADGDIDIRSATSIDYYTGGPAAGETSGNIVIVFTNEETVSGSGTVYTLHGTINGTVDSGDSLSFNFLRNSLSMPVTGYLTNVITNSMIGPNIDIGDGPGGSLTRGTFVWSDNSEVPHSYASGTADGSRDWTEDLYVEDLTQQSTLSR